MTQIKYYVESPHPFPYNNTSNFTIMNDINNNGEFVNIFRPTKIVDIENNRQEYNKFIDNMYKKKSNHSKKIYNLCIIL